MDWRNQMGIPLMGVLDRALGLFVAIYYISVPVVSYHYWRTGHRLVGALLFIAPIAAVLVWEISPYTGPAQRADLGIALLPALVLPAIGPIFWLASGSKIPLLARIAERAATTFSRHPFTVQLGRALVVLGVVGVAWFLFDFDRVEHSCRAVDTAGGSGMALGMASCLRSGLGTWPAWFLVGWLVAARRVRTGAGATEIRPGR